MTDFQFVFIVNHNSSPLGIHSSRSVLMLEAANCLNFNPTISCFERHPGFSNLLSNTYEPGHSSSGLTNTVHCGRTTIHSMLSTTPRRKFRRMCWYFGAKRCTVFHLQRVLLITTYIAACFVFAPGYNTTDVRLLWVEILVMRWWWWTFVFYKNWWNTRARRARKI